MYITYNGYHLPAGQAESGERVLAAILQPQPFTISSVRRFFIVLLGSQVLSFLTGQELQCVNRTSAILCIFGSSIPIFSLTTLAQPVKI